MSQNNVLVHPKYVRSKELGDEITELYGYITAATYDAVFLRGPPVSQLIAA